MRVRLLLLAIALAAAVCGQAPHEGANEGVPTGAPLPQVMHDGIGRPSEDKEVYSEPNREPDPKPADLPDIYGTSPEGLTPGAGDPWLRGCDDPWTCGCEETLGCTYGADEAPNP